MFGLCNSVVVQIQTLSSMWSFFSFLCLVVFLLFSWYFFFHCAKVYVVFFPVHFFFINFKGNEKNLILIFSQGCRIWLVIFFSLWSLQLLTLIHFPTKCSGIKWRLLNTIKYCGIYSFFIFVIYYDESNIK